MVRTLCFHCCGRTAARPKKYIYIFFSTVLNKTNAVCAFKEHVHEILKFLVHATRQKKVERYTLEWEKVSLEEVVFKSRPE